MYYLLTVGASVICTAPTVPYSVKLKTGEIRYVSNPADFPESSELSSAVYFSVVNINLFS